jgi:hypothetical protein
MYSASMVWQSNILGSALSNCSEHQAPVVDSDADGVYGLRVCVTFPLQPTPGAYSPFARLLCTCLFFHSLILLRSRLLPSLHLMAPHDGNTANDLGLPTFQAKREVLSPLPFRDILDDEDEDGEEELDDDAADELPDDIDPSSGVNFFRITEEDRVQNQRVVHKTVKELFGKSLYSIPAAPETECCEDMVMSEKLDFKPEYQRGLFVVKLL